MMHDMNVSYHPIPITILIIIVIIIIISGRDY